MDFSLSDRQRQWRDRVRAFMDVHVYPNEERFRRESATSGEDRWKVTPQIVEELKPEAVYFTEQHGERCAVLIVDVADASRIPSFAEPFFINFNADTRFRIVMSPADLGKAGLDELGKKWR